MADPAEGLEPDITTIEDAEDRRAEQYKYYGGDFDEDDDDVSALDRGDNLEEEPTDRGDALQKEEEDDEESEAEADDAEAEADADADDDQADSDEDADSEEEDVSETAERDDDDGKQSKSDERDDPRIPLARFNEVNERMKRAEQRLAELEKQEEAQEQAAEQKYDFDKAEAEYMELLLDGKLDEAGAKRREIRSAEQEVFKADTKTETIQDFDQQQEMRDLNALSLQAEEMFPVFNENSAEYDPVLANKVVTYMKGYLSEGQTVSDAFVSGLADVIQQYDLDGAQKQTKAESIEKTKEKKGAPIKKTKDKIEAAKKQGQSPVGHGKGSSDAGVAAPSIEEMSDADLDRLSPDQLARMRGDYVE